MTRLKRKKELPSSEKNDVRFGTPQEVADYRAKRIASLKPDTVIEVGAGAGFQTASFAKVAKRVIAIEIDKERAHRGVFAENVTVIIGDALNKEVIAQVKAIANGTIVVFLDPQRPPSSEKRTIEELQPNIAAFITAYSAISPNIAIELPPFLADISFDCEKEYVSIDRKLNRLTIYFGALATGNTTVIALPQLARISATKHPDELQSSRITASYICEPDAALAHAGLTALAAESTPYMVLPFGKRYALLTEKPLREDFFKNYKIMVSGTRTSIERAIPTHRIGGIVLHGQFTADEQVKTLQLFQQLCRGKRRAHVFAGTDGMHAWYLTVPV